MKSFRQIATAQQNPPPTVSARSLAQSAGVPLPTGLSHLIDALSAPVSFHEVIGTPSGTALGGTVDVTVSRDGSFSFDVHMHDSGFDPYTFRVRCALQSPGGLVLLFQTSGHTDGTGSNPFGHVNREFDHHEDGMNPSISQFWLDVRASKMSVSKSYEDVGVFHNPVVVLPPPLLPPTISSVVQTAGKFEVKGKDFLKSHAVHIRVVNDARPLDTNFFFQATSDSTGNLDAMLTVPPQTSGTTLDFSANDERSNSSDATGTLWSNTFKISV